MILALGAIAAVAGDTPPAPVRELVETADHAFIALHHRDRPGAPAVVLCHGISSNHTFWDLEPGRSLSEHLWRAGFDVWNLDLRGHGDAVNGPDGARQRGGFDLDDYGDHDLVAAFAHVREATGQPALHYVGHSMGGMVLAVWFATHPDAQHDLASAVVVGSPLDFRDSDPLFDLLLDIAPLTTAVDSLPTPLGARALANLRRSAPGTLDALLHNPENLSPDAEKRMFRSVVSPLWAGEIKQLRQVRSGEFRSRDGSVAYREALDHVTVPILFVAGRADHVAPPDRVRGYFDAVPNAERELYVVSKANGAHGDYGHLDLGVGDDVAADVFAPITSWLLAHP